MLTMLAPMAFMSSSTRLPVKMLTVLEPVALRSEPMLFDAPARSLSEVCAGGSTLSAKITAPSAAPLKSFTKPLLKTRSACATPTDERPAATARAVRTADSLMNRCLFLSLGFVGRPRYKPAAGCT